MNKKDKYYGMENATEMNQSMGGNPYMGMSMNPMMSMMPMFPRMMPMNYPMMQEDMMPNMAMQPMNPMQTMMCMMPMNPMMMCMNPMMMDENMQDEDYINYMINMNKYLSHMYKAEAYKLQAMQYTKDME
ncbi:MAG: hypothetical protein N4A68_11305 [Maledivibacter sp.]|nr:hypothetical protein [Maledivibacter sp.]